MSRPAMPLFAIATLMPVPLLAAAAFLGGTWAVAALLYLTLACFALDEAIPFVVPDAPEGAEFPAANSLSVTLALAHFALLPLGTWAVAGGSGLGGVERALLFLAFGLFFGQIGNANAHELIHRGNRWLHGLGKWVYISVLFGHHASAHPLIHHRYVATPEDPNSARAGESYYRFAPRAWAGSFVAGLRAETARRKGQPFWRHPYAAYVTGGLAVVAAMTWAFGPGGLAAYLGLALYAQAQLLLSDYVQHYGLHRRQDAAGRYEPVTDNHSWDAPHWFSGYMMLHAPRHSDHHAHPTRIYPALRLPERQASPMLPHSLPAMATVALFPRLWRRMMDRRAARWSP